MWVFCVTETVPDKIPVNIATLVLLAIKTPNIIKLANITRKFFSTLLLF